MIRLLVYTIGWLLRVPLSLLRWVVRRIRRRERVLVVRLTGDHPWSPRWRGIFDGGGSTLARRDLHDVLQDAAGDDALTRIGVRIGRLGGGWGEVHALRAALTRAREGGKRVTAHLTHPDLRTLWLASAADEVLIDPHTPVDVRGAALEMLFFGEALERAGLTVDAVAAGDYKSAMEPFTRTAPSEPAAEALRALLDDLYDSAVDELAARRGRPVDAVRAALESGPLQPEQAVEAGLADGLLLEEKLLPALGCEDPDPPADAEGKNSKRRAEALSVDDYDGPIGPLPRWTFRRGPQIAVVELLGNITDDDPGGRPARGITPSPATRALRRARRSRRIKGVLLRVDSRGGSATASERIWRAVRSVAAHKPVVAVMGDYAASGGYYIACAAHEVIAAPGTLTGSIGVISAKPHAERLLAKLGIHPARFERGERALMYSGTRGFTEEERAAMQAQAEWFYDLFVGRVAESRDRPREDVEPHARGRVWTGRQALERGLVDALGDEAVALERLMERAELKKPPVLVYAASRGQRLRALLGRASVVDAVPGLELLRLAADEPVLMLAPIRLK